MKLAGEAQAELIKIAAIAIGGGALIYLGYKLVTGGYKAASDAVANVLPAINPLSNQNLAYKGVNSVGEKLTGDSNFTLGGWLYDINPFANHYDPTAPATPTKKTPAVADNLIDYNQVSG